MSGQLQIRLYDTCDEPAVIALLNEAFPSSQPWNDPATVIARKTAVADGLFFIGESDGTIVATAIAGYDGIRGWIYSVAVAADCRRRGFGRQIIEHAENALRSRGCPKVNLQVLGSNTEVVAFYERLDYQSEDRVSMGKPLTRRPEEHEDAPATSSGADDVFRSTGQIDYRDTKSLPREAVLKLYGALNWSAAQKPDALMQSLKNAHSLITAWDGERLVGLANAISDSFLVVYFPHALVLPEYQSRGIGREMMARMMKRYEGFHQQALIADEHAVEFYEQCGFTRAGRTVPMWIFDGDEH